MHLGRKPPTTITKLIGQPECLMSNWKKTLTNYISAQPTELQMFTINEENITDSKKRARSVSPEFKQYQFFEKENKPNTLKCRFKANKLLTAVKETKHTITTSEGKTIHKKLASKPIKFQLSREPEERRKQTNRCRRCGKFCQGEFCDTHKRVYGIPKSPQEPCSKDTLPTMPQKRSTYGDITTAHAETDAHEPQAATPADEQHVEQIPTVEETQPKEDNPPEANIPLPTTPILCSTSHGPRPSQREDEQQTTPIRATVIAEGSSETEKANKEKGKTDSKETKLKNDKVTFEQSSDLRRSDKIKGARRTEKLGGVEYY